MWQSVEILNVFNNLTLKSVFWRTKTFFKKLENRFLVESYKTEKVLFSYKPAIAEANVKTNRMVSTKWTFQKEWSFASHYFFSKPCFSLRTSYKELIWFTNDPMPIFVLFVSAGVSFDGAFTLWVSLKKTMSIVLKWNSALSIGNCESLKPFWLP